MNSVNDQIMKDGPVASNEVANGSKRQLEIRVEDFQQLGLYLLFPGGKRIVLSREKIESFAHAFENNLDQFPEEIRCAVAFQACPVCPERERAIFCHALPATLAYFEELNDFRSYENVCAVYRDDEHELILVPKTTMQEALQYVVIFSLLYYCEVGKQYRKYFLGVHPLMRPDDMITRIHLNVYWDCKGDKQKIEEAMGAFGSEIACTCRCQVERLGLICKNDALMNAFAHTQAQIQWLVMIKDEQLEQSFADFMKKG